MMMTKQEIKKTLLDIPHDVLAELAAKTYILVALCWDYVDTILDICAQMRTDDLKKLCRQIRQMRFEYDQHSESRRITAAIIVNKLNDLELIIDHESKKI